MRLNFGKSTVYRFLQRGPDDNKRREGTGRSNAKTTPRQDKKLKELSLSGRFKTANELRDQWKKKTRGCIDVPKSTVNRRLTALDLPPRKPKKAPLQNEMQTARRLAFTEKYRKWRRKEWRQVIFSDETWFQLRSSLGAEVVKSTSQNACYHPQSSTHQSSWRGEQSPPRRRAS